MPNQAATAIANEFLSRRGSPTWPRQMLLQKLAYIANGWNLAINGEPLITETPQAWDNGPVYTSLWRAVKDYGYQGENCEILNPFSNTPWKADLTASEAAIIDHVWKKYGSFSAEQLSDMTHEPGTPWFNAYLNQGRNSELNQSEIRQHYIKLAMAGREETY